VSARVAPLARADLAELEPVFAAVFAGMGFVPNSMLTMARSPQLLRAFAGLAMTVLGPGTLSAELKQLVAHVASLAAGCRYCQAHTGGSAARAGASHAKVGAAFEFETSALFSAAERAALRLARDAAQAPSLASDAHFAELREHFSEAQITELVSVIALFGFLNRWNDTMATTLEPEPRAFASEALSRAGWKIGAHG